MFVIPFPTIDPVLIEIGPIDIRWYALAYITGLVLGWRYMIRLARRQGTYFGKAPVTAPMIDDFFVWATIGVIVGGRLGFAFLYEPGYYLSNPLEIILGIRNGGMAFHGGLMGVVLAIILFSLKRGLHPFILGDLVACAAPIGLFFGRIANFINGELWGRPTDVPWAMVFPNAPGDLPRHPSQLYEAGLEGLILFVILLLLAYRSGAFKRPGILIGVFLIGYGIARFLVEFVRDFDPDWIYFGWLTLGQIYCLPMVAAGLWFIWRAYSKTPDEWAELQKPKPAKS